MPKTLHVDAPSSKVDWDAGQIELLTEAEPWQANGQPAPRRRLLLRHQRHQRPRDPRGGAPSGEAEQRGEGREEAGATTPCRPGPARALGQVEAALHGRPSASPPTCRRTPSCDPTDVAYSLATTRAPSSTAPSSLGAIASELLEALAALGDGEPGADARRGRRPARKLAFLFTGQGSPARREWAGSSTRPSPPSRSLRCASARELRPPARPAAARDRLRAPKPRGAALLEHTAYAQPALFAIEVALYRALGEPRACSPTALSATRSARSPPPTSPASSPRRRRQARRRRRPADGRAARGRGDGRDRGHRGRGRSSRSQATSKSSRSPRSTAPARSSSPASEEAIETARSTLAQSRAARPSASPSPRLPLAADGADAGGVRAVAAPRPSASPDPDRLQPHRRAAQHRAGHRARLLGRATCASRSASPTAIAHPRRPGRQAPTSSSAPTRSSARWRRSAWATTDRRRPSRPAAARGPPRGRGPHRRPRAAPTPPAPSVDWDAFFAGRGAKPRSRCPPTPSSASATGSTCHRRRRRRRRRSGSGRRRAPAARRGDRASPTARG